MTVRLAILSSLVCWIFFAQVGQAQTRSSMNQGRSGFGQSGFGQGSGSFGSGGQSRGGGFGNSGGFGSFGGGNGRGFGAGGLGQQGFGNNQLGAGLGGDTFIGNDAAQTQNFFRNMNRGQQPSAMLDFMIENLNEMRDRDGRGNGQDRTPPVRVKLRPAFETPLGTMQKVSADLETRLLASAADIGITDVKISREGRIVTLEGTVATEHQRQLAEKVLSFEPGVSTIDNRLVVEAVEE